MYAKMLRNPGKKTSSTDEAVGEETKPRPLLISFKEEGKRSEILKNTRKLAKSVFSHISVCPDLTKTQQKDDQQLRNEASELNAENPQDEKGCFYGRWWELQDSQTDEK